MRQEGEEKRRQARWRRICAVLDAVLDAPEAERARMLDAQCAGDPDLRAEVEALLAAEAVTDRRIDSPVADWAGGALGEGETAQAHVPSETVGRYRLVRELGRGGMGAVWLAERFEEGFEQQVALKLLKRGLDTDAILERFLEERRILARLRHPNIALFLDGGVSGHGQPWFAMEWVDGEPITRWCDARTLAVRERVALFLDVIAAVQYAHQQLVVHRDLKPGNVMVGGGGQVKLLDFGIAKMLEATEGSAEAATLTRLGWRMLTPEYAAPEQLRGEPVSTATDVYALGVLLCELLVGQRPSVAGAAAPQRPSAQLSEAAAALRGGGRERLRRMLRGDLDTIVLKALQPEPARRYGSAQALGEDLRRWLDGQPVQARPDSAWYRTHRFVSRHRWGTAAAVVVALSLATGALVAAWQAREAQRQALAAKQQALEAKRQTQRAELAKDFLIKIISQSDPYAWRDDKEPTVTAVLEAGTRLADEDLRQSPQLHAEMLVALGNIYEARGQLDRAEGLMRRSLQERRKLFGENHEAYADSLFQLSSVLYAKGDWKAAQQAASRAAAIFERTLGSHPRTAEAYEGMANALGLGNDPDEAIRLRRRALEILRRAKGENGTQAARVEQTLGLDLIDRGRHAEGEAMLKHAVDARRRLSGPRSLGYANALGSYATGLANMGEIERSIAPDREALAIYRKFRDAGQLEIAIGNLGQTYQRVGRFGEAERALREALDIAMKGPKAGTRWEGRRLLGLANLLVASGRHDEAEPLMRQALAIMERDAGPEHEWTAEVLNKFAGLRLDQGRTEEAAVLAKRADTMLRRQYGPDDFRTALNQGLLARLQYLDGDPEAGLASSERALRSVARARGTGWASTSSAASGLAKLQLQVGQARQAEAAFGEIARASDAKELRPEAVEAGMLRGAALMLLGRLKECEPVLREALSRRQALYGDGNPWTGEARLYLGVCLSRQGRVDEGRALIGRGRKEFARQFGANHFVVRLADQSLRSGR
ncbi:serine/threonine-protein kinase [Luteimonas aquatica]|uniref:serine/threonine-protein kinase n=1 Tax=Luteimonas aquatica TaxID=450364 RepID=UPI001F57B0C1|nr:serine/threonine-protein kinase [Luteimonas aquatica]